MTDTRIMASGERQKFEEAASTSYRSAVWQHFGFAVDYNDQGTKMVTKTKTVCKYCLTTIPYITGNTTNMTTHLRRHHPDKSSASGAEDKVTRPKSQSSIADAFQKKYTFTSDKHKKITRAVGTFIAKALQPYSVVENDGFSYLMKTVDPRYAIPSRTYYIMLCTKMHVFIMALLFLLVSKIKKIYIERGITLVFFFRALNVLNRTENRVPHIENRTEP